MAPPERTNRSGTASVLPPAPTISSSRVRVSREPARRVVDEERSDEDEDGDGAEKKGKGTELGEDGDEGEDEDEGKMEMRGRMEIRMRLGFGTGMRTWVRLRRHLLYVLVHQKLPLPPLSMVRYLLCCL